jgi:cell division septation protein DedD
MHSPYVPPVADKMTLDTSKESATQALYRAAIGPLNIDYYLPIFSGFESTTKIALRWNTAASLYTLNWMVFRRLWGAALIYAVSVTGVALVVFGLGRLVFQTSTEVELSLAILLLVLSVVVPGFFGNAWLHADSRRRMALALNQSTTLQHACDRLRGQSSSRNRFLGMVTINVVLIGVGLGLYLKLDGAVEIQSAAPLPVLELAALPTTILSVEMKSTDPVDVAIETPPPDSSLPPEPIPPPEPPMAQPAIEASTPAQPRSGKPIAVDQLVSPNFYVNVGLFANTDNAERAHQRLKEAGLAVTTETLNMPKGQRSRVRVGPFPNRSEADDVARTIKTLGLDAIVFAK